MATLDLRTIDARLAGKVDLDPVVFEAPLKPHLLHAEVRRQLARRRAGTHSTKNRAGVSGGGAKPYRQKGTGRARQGTIRAPQYAGGGVVFGPVPRGYEHKLPRQVRRAALCAALSTRQAEGAVTVVDALELGEFKTQRLLAVLDGLGVGADSTLIVSEGPDSHLERSARNLPGVDVLRVAGLNVYDILRRKKLVLTQAALDAVQARFQADKGASE